MTFAYRQIAFTLSDLHVLNCNKMLIPSQSYTLFNDLIDLIKSTN